LTVGVATYLAWAVVIVVLAMIFPILLIIGILDRKNGYRRLKGFAFWFIEWFFLGYLPLTRLYKLVETPSKEQACANQPCIYVANHRSGLDAILAFAYFPKIRIPVKKTYLDLPLLGLIIRWIGCISFDRKDPQSIIDGVKQAEEILAAGESLFVFPEGTRSGSDGTSMFSDVFFRVALNANVPVVPVIIHSDVPFLAPEGKSILTRRRAAWRIIVEEPLRRDKRDRPSDLSRSARRVISKKLASLATSKG